MSEMMYVFIALVVITILNIYMVIGAVIAVDVLMYLRMIEKEPTVTVGRVITMVLFWLPVWMDIRDKSKKQEKRNAREQ